MTTGSGKTVVAAFLTLQHLRKMKAEGRAARVSGGSWDSTVEMGSRQVVLVVPKVFLVEQQATLIRSYTGNEWAVEELSGDSAVESGECFGRKM